MGRRRGDMVLSRLIILRIIIVEKFPIKDRGVWAWPQAPQPKNPAEEDDTLKCLTLNANRVLFQEIQRTVGNRDSILKECIQNSVCSGTQGRSSNLEPHGYLGESPGEAEGKWSLPWGHRHERLILGSVFYYMDIGAGKNQFGVPSLTF